jgi:hypothetical protein
MKHPTPSDFLVEVKEAHVSVIFKPRDSHYDFGRLVDPKDIAQFGPLSRSANVGQGSGETGTYPSDETTHGIHVGRQGDRDPLARPSATRARGAAIEIDLLPLEIDQLGRSAKRWARGAPTLKWRRGPP